MVNWVSDVEYWVLGVAETCKEIRREAELELREKTALAGQGDILHILGGPHALQQWGAYLWLWAAGVGESFSGTRSFKWNILSAEVEALS